MTPDLLDNFTPRELDNMLKGFELLEEKRSQDSWYKFRLLASTLLMPHTKNGKGVKPQKLWPFDWEKNAKPKSDKMSAERLDYITKRSKVLRNGR